MTHRQFLVWRVWQEAGWNRPTRADYYAMQVACQVTRVLAKDPAKITIDKFRLEFGDGTEAGKPDKKAQMEWSKSKWLGAMTMKVEQRTISRQEAIDQGFLEADTPYIVQAIDEVG